LRGKGLRRKNFKLFLTDVASKQDKTKSISTFQPLTKAYTLLLAATGLPAKHKG